MKLTALTIALLLLSSSVFGCKETTEENISSENSVPVFSENSSESSSDNPSLSSQIQDGTILDPIVTDSEEFNQIFAENPIDQAYISDSYNAVSNRDMIDIAEKYSKIWQEEIDVAYKRLLEKAPEEDKPMLKQEQADWVDNTPASLEEITESAMNIGGSLAQVVASNDQMEYYRLRGASVYRELYEYEPDFSFSFSVKG